MTKIRRTICHILAACVAALVVAPMTFWATDKQSPIIIHESAIFPPNVRPGSSATITWTATELRSCTGIIHRRFVDSQWVVWAVTPVPSVYRALLKGKTTFSREIIIPLGMAPGPATFTGARVYYCNPLHQLAGWLGMDWLAINVPTTPVRFNVLAK